MIVGPDVVHVENDIDRIIREIIDQSVGSQQLFLGSIGERLTFFDDVILLLLGSVDLHLPPCANLETCFLFMDITCVMWGAWGGVGNHHITAPPYPLAPPPYHLTPPYPLTDLLTPTHPPPHPHPPYTHPTSTDFGELMALYELINSINRPIDGTNR